MSKQNSLPQEQLDRIEQFITAYNAIDRYLREALGERRNKSFSQLVREYGAKFPRWTAGETLLALAELRNFLVHERREAYEYLAVPTQEVVDRIEVIRQRLLAPERVLPRFQRKVAAVQSDLPLSRVLDMIEETGFSQFPVYEGERFAGLLTENGITRWLAGHVSPELTLVDFQNEQAGAVLGLQEERRDFDFIPRDCTVLAAENKFIENPVLEALFITHGGERDQALLGIITRWDLLGI
jgi:CBS domain-containing protein